MRKALTSGNHDFDHDLPMPPEEHGNFGLEIAKFRLQK